MSEEYTQDDKVLDLFGWGNKVKEGRIGIEIECEGNIAAYTRPSSLWNQIADLSLRGGAEYVLSSPIEVRDIDAALEEWSQLTKKCKFVPSIRCSNHFHFNQRGIRIRQLYSFLVFYYLVENILVKANGKSREGNIFCLRLKDAEVLLKAMLSGIRDATFFGPVSSDDFRYSALNLAALRKYGSIEFRFLKGYVNPTEIGFWVKQLWKAFDNCLDKTPQEVYNLYQKNNNMDFMLNFFDKRFVEYLLTHCKGDSWNELINENSVYIRELVRRLTDNEKSKLFYPPVIANENEDLPVDEGLIEALKAQNTPKKKKPKGWITRAPSIEQFIQWNTAPPSFEIMGTDSSTNNGTT